MTAQEYIEANVKKEKQGIATVLTLINNDGWWHVHRDEELPKDHRIVIAFEEKQ